jgi:hypothetical protein
MGRGNLDDEETFLPTENYRGEVRILGRTLHAAAVLQMASVCPTRSGWTTTRGMMRGIRDLSSMDSWSQGLVVLRRPVCFHDRDFAVRSIFVTRFSQP